MSVRAIKKRENHRQQQQHYTAAKSSLQKLQQKQQQQHKTTSNALTTLCSLHGLHLQRNLLGRQYHSCPAVNRSTEHLAHAQRLVRIKSDSDINSNSNNNNNNNATLGHNGHALLNAKSEICLQSISSHSYQSNNNNNSKATKMLSGARSHRDLSQSAYASVGANTNNYDDYVDAQRPRRHSALPSSSSSMHGSIRVPIIGFEIIEERARFTVYKLRVENPATNACWLVLRRYTDFVRINNKLKQQFPHMNLMLPRKKIFGDNFNSVFLDNRVQGLQIFVNNIMAKEELRKCKLVREFFCLDEAPTYSESMEECRAIFEAQEEMIVNLKMQINNKNDLILSLQQQLRDEIAEKQQLKEALNNLSLNQSTHCSSSNGSSAASSN